MKVPLTPLRCLHRALDLYGAKEAIVCGNRRFTYAQFGGRCQKLAAALVRHGVRPGDRVGFLSFNTHKLLEGYYGAPQARAAVMPLNVRLTPAELGGILHHAEPRMLFFENDFAGLVEQLRAAYPPMRTVNLDTEYDDFIAGEKAERADISAVDEDSMAELFYTSGSTGTPKGVMLSHRTVYMHALAVAGTFNRDDREVELHTIPLFHANGWGRPQTATMMGLGQVMVRRFDPPSVCRLIQEERATAMSLVPAMGSALLNVPDLARYDFSSMIQILLGGAAASPLLIERLE
jgi:fatty-acyl-CoA synthase